MGYNTTLSGWAATGVESSTLFGTNQNYKNTFVFAPGTAAMLSTTGVKADPSWYGASNLSVYGASAAPDGGTVVVSNAEIGSFTGQAAGGLNQTVNGLTVGTVYELDFNWAAGSFNVQGIAPSAGTDDWSVSLGATTLTTTPIAVGAGAFSGWQSAALDFTATAPSEVLQFTSVGNGNTSDPALLLDNVSLAPAAVPEPASMSVLGLGGLGLLARRRRNV